MTRPGDGLDEVPRPVAALPLPKGHAWSSFGGQWHAVKLGDAVSPYWSTGASLGVAAICTVMASFPPW